MSKNDYNSKKSTDLSTFLPEYVKSDILESLSKNVLNRFLTKTEFANFNGYIGQLDQRSELNRIPERTPLRTKNQLQPIINNKQATESQHMSFEDFIKRLDRMGVDVNYFDEWGRSQQFNWVPPINIDKIINYQDYYWDSTETPEYITIRNQKTHISESYDELKNAFFRRLNTKKALSIQDIEDNAESNYVIFFSDIDNKNIIGRVENNTLYAVEHDVDLSLITTINDFVELDFLIKEWDTESVIIDGNLLEASLEGIIVALYNTPETTNELAKIVEVLYDELTNTSTIVFESPPSNQYTKISLHPHLISEYYNSYFNAHELSREYTGNLNGFNGLQTIWLRNRTVTAGSAGETVLGSSILTDNSTSTDFSALYNTNKNYYLLITNGTNKGLYEITSISTNQVEIVGSLFQASSIEYEILEKTEIEDIKSQHDLNKYEDYPWYDEATDTLYKYSEVFNSYVTLIRNFSLILGSSSLTLFENDNEWILGNKWLHKNQIKSFAGKIQAKIPIIEYESYIELSKSSSVEYKWRYSPSSNQPRYSLVESEPTLLEIQPLELTTDDVAEYNKINSNTIEIPERFGNLEEHLSVGDKLVFLNFQDNNGVLIVEGINFISPSNRRAFTEIIFSGEVPDSTDIIPDTSIIYPEKTSLGDSFDPDYDHWEFGGVKSISASSIDEDINPMLDKKIDEIINYVSSDNKPYQTIIGLVWQEFVPLYNIVYSAPMLLLDSRLHDLCLYEDYQEGDIRVYIDGKRQYGNFQEVADPTGLYITGIIFDPDVEITQENRVRIELGEYFKKDIGKRAVNVKTQQGRDIFNLVDDRRQEQEKTESNQYPLFRLYDVFGNPVRESNSIFMFKEDKSFRINPELRRRIVREELNRDFTFENLLFKEDREKMLCYKDYTQQDITRSIWRKGNNNEQQIPEKIGGEWDIPNSWFYNLEHKNNPEVKLTEFFRHFRTIIEAQDDPKYFGTANTPVSYFHGLQNPNYGLGGTIKEHNDNLDLLASLAFVQNINPINVFSFVENMYESQIDDGISFILQNINILIQQGTSQLTEALITYLENNKKYDQWFGDSSTWDGTNGIKGFVTSSAVANITPLYSPSLLTANGEVLIRHHDGHISKISLNNTTKILSLKNIIKDQQLVENDSDALPNTLQYDINDIVLRLVSSTKQISLFKLSSSGWEEVCLEECIAEVILAVEERLYNIALVDRNNNKKHYDFEKLKLNPRFSELENAEFIEYYLNKDQNLLPLENTRFNSSDPFTWNYSFTSITEHPVTGTSYISVGGSWQAVYESLYGTAYPNLEPWFLQGYRIKPSWWDDAYRNSDPTIQRTWKIQMWNNILSGIIPVGNKLPNGSVSTGISGEVTPYLYVPVNILNSNTNDGYAPDELLPPFWDSTNSPSNSVKTPYRKENNEYINAPSSSFLFGQNGYNEWEWRNSVSYNYAMLRIAFKLDPMKLTHRIFGNQYVNVDCLQVEESLEKVYSHEYTIFHGDMIDTNKVSKSSGLLEWMTHYNRYKGFDGESSRYRKNWTDWDINLSYLFDNIINTESIELRNETIDITERDYNIELKKTEGLDDFDFKALNVTMLKTPAGFLENKEISKDWIFNVTPLSPKNNKIECYLPENYPFTKVSTSNTEFKIYNHELTGAGIREPRGFFEFLYSTQLFPATPTSFSTSNNYSFIVNSVNGDMINQTFTFSGENIATVEDALRTVNNSNAPLYLEVKDGNLIAYSKEYGSNSSLDITDINFFASVSNTLYNTNSGQTGYEFEKYFEISLTDNENIKKGDTIEIVNSQNFEGSYTIKNIFTDIQNSTFRVYVEEDVPLSNSVIDGQLIPSNARTLPWETGQEVFFNTTGVLPGKLLDYVPYYIIKIDDYTFEVAETLRDANEGNSIQFSNSGAGYHKVGRVRNTFKVLGGRIDYSWRRHFYDKREVFTLNGPCNISTIQSMIDISFGYEEYLNDIGIFSDNEKLDNIDTTYSRAYDWQLEVEKLIDWLFTIVKTKEERYVTIEAEIDNESDSLNVLGNTIPWQNGDQVVLEQINGILPAEINTGFNNFIPFYIIRNPSGTRLQLASTRRNALNGINIPLTGGSGAVEVKSFRRLTSRPTKVLNPYVKQFNIRHELGLPSDFTEGSNLSIVTNQQIYDQSLNELTIKDLLFFRNDKESTIKTVEDSNKKIYGATVFLDGLEHLIMFNDYSTDGKLIYDAFIGITTPRFFIEFVKPLQSTQRPSASGLIINGDRFTSNIEKSIEDIRYYYDTYRPFESEDTTISARDSIGYAGREEYMDSLGVNAKSQFIFWKGYIQSKGSQKALEAFTNHRLLNDIKVDEFWAYRLCSFGDSKLKIYPEMNLFTEDVIKKELRIEFSPPTGGIVGGPEFTQVRLTDRERWNNQPDIIEELEPLQSYFFNAKVVEIIDQVESLWLTPTLSSYNDIVIPLNRIADAAIIHYEDSMGNKKFALEQKDFVFSNSKTIRVINTDANTWTNVTLVTYTYSYDEEQPAKIIDKSKIAKVVTDVPIWNPVLGQHNPLGVYPIDLEQQEDPAVYYDKNFWSDKEVGTVWYDNSMAIYKPYYDKRVYPSLDDRSLYWGNLAEFGDVRLYQWVKTNIPPQEYDALAEEQELDQSIPVSERITGQTKKETYKNVNGSWVKDKDILLEFFPETYDTNIVSTLTDHLNDLGENTATLNVYVNGSYTTDLNIQTSQATNDITNFLNSAAFEPSSHISILKPEHIPSEEEIDAEEYKILIPHNMVVSYNNKNNEETSTYYYWVRNLKNEKLLDNTSLTLFDAENELREMNHPYMFLDGVRYEGVGYGVLFGSTFDPDEYNLPLRYTQCIVKGLEGTVKDNNRYVLRFIKDYTLRDKLDVDSLNLQNKHWEWKLIRRNQPFNIDKNLWIKVIESAVGHPVNENYEIDFLTDVPSLERVTFDLFVQRASSSIGLKPDQVLAPKDIIIDTIINTLLDERRWKPKVDIVNMFDLGDPESVRDMLVFIYENLQAEELNDIFFEILEESIILNREHPDFFKTSWVSIDVEGQIDVNPLYDINIAEVYPSSMCFLD